MTTKQQKCMRIDESTYQDLVRYKSQISSITGKPVSFDNAIKGILDIATSREYFCAVQETDNEIIIFGIGRTPAEACIDVVKHNGAGETRDDLDLWPCSLDVFVYVTKHGGVAYTGQIFVKTDNKHIDLVSA